MVRYRDVCPGSYADDGDLEFDESSGTWTVREAWGADAIPGIADKELALAIARSIYAAWREGWERDRDD